MSSPKVVSFYRCKVIQTVTGPDGKAGSSEKEFLGKNQALKTMKARGFPGHIVMELSRSGLIEYEQDGYKVELRLELKE